MKNAILTFFVLLSCYFAPAQKPFDILKHTQWTYNISKYASEVPLADATSVYVGADNSPVVCLDKKTGKEKWKLDVNIGEFRKGFIHTLQDGYDGKIYFNGTSQGIFCVSKEDGKIIWTYDCKFDDDLFSKIIIADNTLYVNPNETFFIALSTDGELLWKTKLTSICTCYSINENEIYCQLADSFCILDNKTGKILRTKKIFGENYHTVYAPVCIGNSLLVCNSRDSLICLDKKTFKVRWQKTGFRGIHYENKNLYAWSEVSFQKIDIENGKALWSIEDDFSWYLQPTVYKRVLYLQTRRKFIIANNETGEVRFLTSYPDKSYTKPIVEHDKIYLGYAGKYVSVMNPVETE